MYFKEFSLKFSLVIIKTTKTLQKWELTEISNQINIFE